MAKNMQWFLSVLMCFAERLPHFHGCLGKTCKTQLSLHKKRAETSQTKMQSSCIYLLSFFLSHKSTGNRSANSQKQKRQEYGAKIVIHFSKCLLIIHVWRRISVDSVWLGIIMQVIFVSVCVVTDTVESCTTFPSLPLQLNLAFILFNDCYTTYCAKKLNKAHHQWNIWINVNLKAYHLLSPSCNFNDLP